jgi:hypothetical protein
MKSAGLGLALTAGLVAAIAGYFALVAPKTAGKRHRSDRPKHRLTTDQMALVAGRRMLLYRSLLAVTHTPARRHI